MANFSSVEIENELKRILKIPHGVPDASSTARQSPPLTGHPIRPPPGFSVVPTGPPQPPVNTTPADGRQAAVHHQAPGAYGPIAASHQSQSQPQLQTESGNLLSNAGQPLSDRPAKQSKRNRIRKKNAAQAVQTSDTPTRPASSSGTTPSVLEPDRLGATPGAASLISRALSDMRCLAAVTTSPQSVSKVASSTETKPCQTQVVHLPIKDAGCTEMTAAKRVNLEEEALQSMRTASKDLKAFNLAKMSTLHPKDLPPNLLNILKTQSLIPVQRKSPKHPNAKFNCVLCKYHCDNLIVCETHIRGDRHIALLKEQSLDMSLSQLPLPNCHQTAVISRLIENIVDDNEITDADFAARQKVVDELNELIVEGMPAGCKVQMFGSVYTQLGMRDCIVDVHLDVPADSPLNPAFMLRACLELLRTAPAATAAFEDVACDFEAKMPSVTFVHRTSRLAGIISINKMASVQTSMLLRQYSLLEPRCRKLAVAFRLWAKTCKVDNQLEGTLPAHAFDLMLIYFMQQLTPPVLPVLQELSAKKDGVEYSSAAEASLLWRTENDMSLGYLWVELFRYFAVIFPNVGCALCITDSKPVPLSDKRWQGVKLGIEDPFNKKRNLTRCISSKRMCDFVLSCFKLTFQYFGIPQTERGPLFYGIPRPPPVLSAGDKASGATAGATSGSGSTQTKPAQAKFECYLTDDEKINHLGDKHLPPGFTNEDILKNKLLKERAPECPLVVTDVSGGGDVRFDADRESPGQAISHFGNAVSNGKVGDNGSEHSDSNSDSDGEEEEGVGGGAGTEPQQQKPNATAVAGDSKKVPGESEGKPKRSKKGKRALRFTLLPTPAHILKLIAALPAADYVYCFLWKDFTGGLEPLIECTICQKEGHFKTDCPDEKLPPIIPLPPPNLQFMQLISGLCVAVADFVQAKRTEVEERMKVLNELKKFTRQFYPDAEMKLFGSSCNGFGFRRSDLDICLTFQSNDTGKGLNYSEIIVQLAEKLKNFKGVHQVIPIPTAKVPIVKFVHRWSKLDCDLSLYNNLAHHNTQMLLLYTKIDARVPILGCMVKHFAKLCSIGDASRGSLSSYAYILMMLHFLQQRNPPVIPVLQEVYYEGRTPPEVIVDGWNAWFFNSAADLKSVWIHYDKNKESLGELWLGFLRYYVEEFNFKEHVINIRRSKPLTRFEKLWNAKCLAIEDPFDLSHNLGSGISRKMNAHILKAFIKGRELFGTPIFNAPARHNSIEEYLLNADILTGGKAPPSDGCCLYCKRIGHWARHCPRKENDERRKAEMKRGGNKNNHQMASMPMMEKQLTNRFPQPRLFGPPPEVWNPRARSGNWRSPEVHHQNSPKSKQQGPSHQQQQQQQRGNNSNAASASPLGQYQQHYMINAATAQNNASPFQLFSGGSRPTRPLAFNSEQGHQHQMTPPPSKPNTGEPRPPMWPAPRPYLLGGGGGGGGGGPVMSQQQSTPGNFVGFASPPSRLIPPFAQQHRPEFNAAPGSHVHGSEPGGGAARRVSEGGRNPNS